MVAVLHSVVLAGDGDIVQNGIVRERVMWSHSACSWAMNMVWQDDTGITTATTCILPP